MNVLCFYRTLLGIQTAGLLMYFLAITEGVAPLQLDIRALMFAFIFQMLFSGLINFMGKLIDLTPVRNLLMRNVSLPAMHICFSACQHSSCSQIFAPIRNSKRLAWLESIGMDGLFFVPVALLGINSNWYFLSGLLMALLTKQPLVKALLRSIEFGILGIFLLPDRLLTFSLASILTIYAYYGIRRGHDAAFKDIPKDEICTKRLLRDFATELKDELRR